MSYTVKQLAKLSGVSVRTLHFYDEVGLLKPAYQGENGYRYYEEEQLLQLQQILFFRELGYALQDIQRILKADDFDKVKSLKSHREVLEKKVDKTRQLIQTIDKTIAKLKGKGTMKDKEMYQGFDKRKQEGYEKELIARFGEKGKKHIEESKQKTKGWTKENWEKVGEEFTSICQALSQEIAKGTSVEDPAVQALIARHYQWICHFWTPSRESYPGLGMLYSDHPDFQKYFEPYHPQLVPFLLEGMKVYANQNLD